jgi:hypothetical protein
LTEEKVIGAHESLMLAFGAYDHLQIDDELPSIWIWPPIWPGFHQSADFKRLANELKLPDYWRKHGFPPQCRPLEDGDFECD